ncbi:X-Pro dipeptidyl-peptidase domain-containing protein [Thecamonas trahens ATCC 50062]|uniref:X-Pro dipeptidyl-peptidase domain-containing protein n=1 Tax=Thecamonas trahens ATCC 50062 TaxID=461836 RepID=A0A0L0DRE2_THETB|nr:X-Pro dipeptidyl-peptidase domain-containing protein [Thecamonas trahens ATCC 50062]KNC54018.1 X-Pro dipeptidyl-peptidase domain-containing protein [Thecamonas trahens ATCC 50062]|eukprot:XP_013754033.1 X-Pro dipeptidyl-peptidase domain-containing protein [Thecamonas trahens ATCC 50062]
MRMAEPWRATVKSLKERLQLPEVDPLPKQVNITMRDGVQLWAMLWLPEFDADGKGKEEEEVIVAGDGRTFSVVVDRTPYGKVSTDEVAQLFLPFGFATLAMNERGTGGSGGASWPLWHTAATDMQDTVAWIKGQPWSNGLVFEAGASADGILTLVSTTLPQQLDAAWMIWSTAFPYVAAWQGGAQRWQLTKHWLAHMQKWRPEAPSYLKIMEDHEAWTPFWQEICPDSAADRAGIKWPSVFWAAAYDIFAQPMLDTYWLQRGSAATQTADRLIFNTRGHCFAEKYFEFPDDRDGDIWSFEQAVNLFKSVEAGHDDVDAFADAGIVSPTASAKELKAVTIYVIGPDPKLKPPPPSVAQHARADSDGVVGRYWTTLDAWPVASNVSYYLAAGGKLETSRPTATTAEVAGYVYNPAEPVPTLGGNNLFMACGPADQQSVESRSDVLVFTSEPFKEPTAMVGRMAVTLFVSSNCTGTDFTVKVTDVYPGTGLSILLSDDVQRMRWRDGKVTPVKMKDGEVYKITIEMWTMAYVFNVGHRVRLAVSSSNYPRFSANPNNGLLVNTTGPAYVAHNAVHYGSEAMPAAIALPVVALEDLPSNVRR